MQKPINEVPSSSTKHDWESETDLQRFEDMFLWEMQSRMVDGRTAMHTCERTKNQFDPSVQSGINSHNHIHIELDTHMHIHAHHSLKLDTNTSCCYGLWYYSQEQERGEKRRKRERERDCNPESKPITTSVMQKKPRCSTSHCWNPVEN